MKEHILIRFMMAFSAAKQVARTHRQGSGSLKLDNRHFTYDEVLRITNNFQTIIGKGGFGTVYHGLLSDGTQVAVKMLSPSSTQGSNEFLTEACHSNNLKFYFMKEDS